MKKSSKEEFIKKAKNKFPEYDYSKVDYINSQTKVIIICSKHGDFQIKPNKLLSNQGCRKCGIESRANKKRHTKDFFTEQAIKVFPDYIYDKVEYIDSDTKVKIECPKHGVFLIRPNDLLHGHGCKQCGNEKIAESKKSNKNIFMTKVSKVFPAYNYEKVEYKGNHTKVIIGCPKHGDFLITPSSLLRGCGCLKCGNESSSKKRSYSNDEFIEKAKKIFPEYLYDKVHYINRDTNISITCIKHGDFEIKPNYLLSGYGCKKCAYEKKVGAFAFNNEEVLNVIKIMYPQYNFEKTEYIDCFTKITVTCPKHGDFQTMPSSLLNGFGCDICGNEKMKNIHHITHEEFILRVIKIFPDYNYTKLKYINSTTEITVTCPIHGDFQTTPNALLRNHGCKQCSIEKRSDIRRSTNEEFILKAKKIFPTYDYKKVKYINNSTKVIIGCPIHGEFQTPPVSLLSGYGCKQCGIEKRAGNQTLTTEEFLEKAKVLFPDYKYQKVIYNSSKIKVTVSCPIHGDFLITPSNLLKGHGCSKCGIEKRANLHRFTNEEFINKAKKIFPEYDYSEVVYKTTDTKVSVICPKHGDFSITPHDLLGKRGCPICKSPKGELVIRNWLKKNNIEYKTQKKFKELGKLSYDFFIESINLLIEFNGKQHYELVPYFHRNGLIDLRIQFFRDLIKKQYAQQIGYELLSIPYWDFDKIEEILNKKIFFHI